MPICIQRKCQLTLLGSPEPPPPELEASGRFKTPTGTITLGGVAEAPPAAATC